MLPFVTSKYFQEFLCSQCSTLADRFSGLFTVVFAAHLSVDVGLKRARQHIDVHNNNNKRLQIDIFACRDAYTLPDMTFRHETLALYGHSPAQSLNL